MAPKAQSQRQRSTGRGLLVFACVFVALPWGARACYDGPVAGRAVSAGLRASVAQQADGMEPRDRKGAR